MIHILTNSLRHSIYQRAVSCQLDELALRSHDAPKLPSVTDIYKAFENDMTNILLIKVIPHENNGYKHADIIASQSKLFFIKYTPENTLRQRWFLVQVDLKATLEWNKDSPTRDSYHYVFLAKHPIDASKSDEFSRF